MLETIEGVYEDGKIELRELPPGVHRARVLVTFLPEERKEKSGKRIRLGQFAGPGKSTEEEFRLAEWHPDLIEFNSE
ncbi:MAG: hypothetical protein WD066_04890 [Planctomycetaceae bacterium]